MAKETKADKAIREAADEIRRESRAAAAEVRLEWGAAKRETSEAMREVMTELRSTLSTIWEPDEPAAAAASGSGTRMSRAQRKEVTRELLLDAALTMFRRDGLKAITMRALTQEAKMSRSTLRMLLLVTWRPLRSFSSPSSSKP